MNFLVVAAHPDDETVTMGGTLAKITSNPDNMVRVIFMNEGVTARLKTNPTHNEIKQNKVRAITRVKETKEALKILGVKNYYFYSFPNNKMETIPQLEINKVIENEIKRFMPDYVFTLSEKDNHLDHKSTFDACKIATRVNRCKVLGFFTMQSDESTEGNYNLFIDITSTFDRKMEAMKKYKSELELPPKQRCVETQLATAQYFGHRSGQLLAEPFTIIYLRGSEFKI